MPSIANLYLRWWDPLKSVMNRETGAPDYMGDGFYNKVMNYATANPEKKPSGNKLTSRATGFGVVRFNTKTRKIKMECWPRNVDITAPDAKQYKGWPRTISQFDKYNPPSWGSMGELTFDTADPVVQLIDAESNEILYTVRVAGKSFQPKAPKRKTFIIKAGKDSPNMTLADQAKTGDKARKVTIK